MPTSTAHARAASRIELVDLVISDRERAEKVRGLYQQIDELLRTTRRAEANELLKVAAETSVTDSTTRDAVARVYRAELLALRRYADLQLEIRRATSPEEFARLDAIK
jgi:hypothetical protein